MRQVRQSANVDSTLGQQKYFSADDENDEEEALALCFILVQLLQLSSIITLYSFVYKS